MGCHIWFARPLTDREFNLMKDYAVKDISRYVNKQADYGVSEAYVNLVKRSVETGEKCIYGHAWYEYCYGSTNPELGYEFFDFQPIVHDRNGKLYICVPDFHNVCRESIGIYTYPHKFIHNKRELRRYIGKKYFNITEHEHWVLDFFWKKYPGGIMLWG